MGLHEAAAATGEALYRDAEDDLVEFLCRIQVQSESQPQLDGGWFRGFDYRRWEFWGSDCGRWLEFIYHGTGWISGEIVSVLALRQMPTSLWDLMADSKIPQQCQAWRARMLPTKCFGHDARRSAKAIRIWKSPAANLTCVTMVPCAILGSAIPSPPGRSGHHIGTNPIWYRVILSSNDRLPGESLRFPQATVCMAFGQKTDEI